MELQINKVEGKQVNQTVDNVVISEGSLTYCIKNNEYGVDLDSIDFAVVINSPNAAPDLLAALRRIVAGHPSESVSNPELWLSAIEMVQIARAAIAKAEGGEG